MHNFKKVLISLLSILLLLLGISSAVILPFLHSEHAYFQDSRLRSSLAGKVDFAVIGASNSLNAYQSAVLDQELGCFSYNLSGSMMKLTDRAWFLEQEFKRNPIDTVVLDLSHDILHINEREGYAVCEEASFGRLGSAAERTSYLLQQVRFDDWLNLYSREFVAGLEYWAQRLAGNELSNVNYQAKGFYGKPSVDLTLSREDAVSQYNQSSYAASFRPENVENYKALIQLCQDHDVRVIVAVAPVPDSVIWCTDNWDSFYHWVQDFCQENGCEFYDMNLLRNRYELFNDKISFADQTHMSEEGAKVYTAAFSHIIRDAETQNVSSYFYDSYEAMKADSPYMQYWK